MVDSIFDRPMFGTPGTSEDIDKQIDRAGRAPEKNEITNKFPQYSYDQIYDDSFMPFDKEGIATLMQTYTAPDAESAEPPVNCVSSVCHQESPESRL